MNQHALFDTPVARATDPGTSHKAATMITRSGQRITQSQITAQMVRQHPNHTCSELGEIGPLNERQLSRRLTDAQRAGLIRPTGERTCRVTGTDARTWGPIEKNGTG